MPVPERYRKRREEMQKGASASNAEFGDYDKGVSGDYSSKGILEDASF